MKTMRVRFTIEGTVRFAGDPDDAFQSITDSPFGCAWTGLKSSGRYDPDADKNDPNTSMLKCEKIRTAPKRRRAARRGK